MTSDHSRGRWEQPNFAVRRRRRSGGCAERPPDRRADATEGGAAVVVVADDVMLTRAGIVRLLKDAGIDVVAEVGDAQGLLHHVRVDRPDVALVDIRMPPSHTDEGLVAAQAIRAELPQVGVLVLSEYVEPAYAMRLLQEHPERVGYLLKESVFDIATVIDPTIVSRLVGRRRRVNPLADLPDREREVLGLIAEGMSNRAIAARLFVTERTVEAHVTQIFQKLRLPESPDQHRRVLAVLAFLRT
jgi:DNA-binding NarL/FixJ family response regulator